MVNQTSASLRVGDAVFVPWGLDAPKRARVVEVWGDPPAHVRIELETSEDEADEPVVILISPGVLSLA